MPDVRQRCLNLALGETDPGQTYIFSVFYWFCSIFVELDISLQENLFSILDVLLRRRSGYKK